MSGVLCTPEQASCIIPSLITELRPPCPCKGREGLFLFGVGYRGQDVVIRILPGVLEVEGISADEVEAIRDRGCLSCNPGMGN